MIIIANTLKQDKWLASYVKTGNATQAARDANYSCDNPVSLRVIAHENLTKLNNGTIKLPDNTSLQEHLDILTPNELLALSSKLAKSAKRDSDRTANIQLLMRYHRMLTELQETKDTTQEKSASELTKEFRELANSKIEAN